MVRIYTTTYCGYCHAAKSLLEKKGVAFEEIDCTDDPETRRWLVERTRRRTVPQIFIHDQSIGGYDELRALDREGKLDSLLQASPSAR